MHSRPSTVRKTPKFWENSKSNVTVLPPWSSWVCVPKCTPCWCRGSRPKLPQKESKSHSSKSTWNTRCFYIHWKTNLSPSPNINPSARESIQSTRSVISKFVYRHTTISVTCLVMAWILWRTVITGWRATSAPNESDMNNWLLHIDCSKLLYKPVYIDDCEMTISTVEVCAGPSLPLRRDVRRMTVQSIVFV